MDPLNDKTILVTGSTDGLGRAVAVELAAAGATVLVHGRDEHRGEQTLRELRERGGGGEAHRYRADLADLVEVRLLAEAVNRDHQRLDVLVNNAGIGTTLPGDGRRVESEDGHELRFAVNYLAPFLLTRLLLPLMLRSAPARIVNVSSAGQAPIDFDDVMLERSYSGTQAYCQSKLAEIMLTFDLADELRGRGVSANCLHPATYMPTKMVLAAGISGASTIEEGTRATMNLIAGDGFDEVSGRYFNGLGESRADGQAYDADARCRLRRLSEELCGLA